TGTGTATSITVTGLTNGTAYTFTVTATNAIGNGLASSTSNSVTPSAPATVPGAPTIGTATAGNLQATVTFTAPASDGGSAITGYTVTSSPGSKTGTGTATSITVTGLTNGTAYTFTVTATNAIGPGLPSAASNSVTPSVPATVTDIDGNIYNTVTIDAQVWMAENLKTTKYNNNESIGTTSTINLNISTETNPKYQWAFDGNEDNVATYGRLYTWYAVTDSRKICPANWHIPTDAEWTTLTNYLGGESVAGGKLKETGTTIWKTPNSGATNESGFTALPGGSRNSNGDFVLINSFGYWWSSKEYVTANGWYRIMRYDDITVFRSYSDKKIGYAVRCLMD
ncbi:MAG: FISUMP domain-containing protein, partial [Bacteroidota bacterium]